MTGPSPRCYIPSFVEVGPLVPEKILEGFLPYMGVAASLVMWLRCREQCFVYKFTSLLHKVNNKRIYKYNKHIRGYGDDKIETINE